MPLEADVSSNADNMSAFGRHREVTTLSDSQLEIATDKVASREDALLGRIPTL